MTLDDRLWIMDASKWQLDLKKSPRTLNLQKAKDQGVDGIIFKYMENLHEDAGYKILLDEARKVFGLWGFYWMHRYDKPWEPQIAMVADEVNKQKPTLSAWADWEKNSYMGAMPARPSIHRVQTEMLRHLRTATGYTLGFYGSQWLLWEKDTISQEELNAPLWVSTLNNTVNFVPNIGPYPGYFLQQYTNMAKGKDFGFEQGTLDLNISQRDAKTALRQLARWLPGNIEITPIETEICKLCATCTSQDWQLRHGKTG